MDKVYVLSAATGSCDDYFESILDIFKIEQDAIDRISIIETEMVLLKNKYTTEEWEKLDDELDDWRSEYPPFSAPYPALPSHLKEFQDHQNKKFYHNIKVTEYIVK